MKRLWVMVAIAAAVAGGAAFAGEVKGPSTDGLPNTNRTAAPDHANSICAFSGLNDFIGPGTDRVQNPAFSGAPGEAELSTLPQMSCGRSSPASEKSVRPCGAGMKTSGTLGSEETTCGPVARPASGAGGRPAASLSLMSVQRTPRSP